MTEQTPSNDLVPENYSAIQSLVTSTANQLRKTDLTNKEAYDQSVQEMAETLGVPKKELQLYMGRQLAQRGTTALKEKPKTPQPAKMSKTSKVLVKVEAFKAEKEPTEPTLRDLMRAQLADVPVGCGKRLTFVSPEVAHKAQLAFTKIARQIWPGQKRNFQTKLNGKVLTVWHLD